MPWIKSCALQHAVNAHFSAFARLWWDARCNRLLSCLVFISYFREMQLTLPVTLDVLRPAKGPRGKLASRTLVVVAETTKGVPRRSRPLRNLIRCLLPCRPV